MSSPFHDSLTRFVFERAAVRGAVVSLDAAYRDILACHPYPSVLQHLLGETLAAVCLLANSLKFHGSLILQLKGSGPIRLLVVECDAELKLRATVQWDGDIAADATLAQLAGDPRRSRLVLTLDPKDGGPLYQGIVALEGGSVAGLFEHYLATSEQLESRLRLAVAEGRACGLLLQRMPASTDADTQTWKRATLAVDAAAAPFAVTDAHTLLSTLFPDDHLRAFSPRHPRFACSCSRERVAGALKMVGRAEIESILAEQAVVGVNCEFCNQRYELDAAEALALFDTSPPAAAYH